MRLSATISESNMIREEYFSVCVSVSVCHSCRERIIVAEEPNVRNKWNERERENSRKA